MSAFRNLVDMRRTPDEKVQAMMPAPLSDDYPGGLCICLTGPDADKLGLNAEDAKVGLTLEFFASAEVISVSKDRIELQIKSMEVDDEEEEEAEGEN